MTKGFTSTGSEILFSSSAQQMLEKGRIRNNRWVEHGRLDRALYAGFAIRNEFGSQRFLEHRP
jgi:hypothetical protein